MSANGIFRLGLIVNPLAGVGGPSAQKGSDAQSIQAAASSGELALTAPARAAAFLEGLAPVREGIELITVPGAMGEAVARDAGWDCQVIDHQPANPTSYKDTEAAAGEMLARAPDLLVFVGGDGTARDVCRVVGVAQPALGVPAGVKMHSGVYAVTPQAAAAVVRNMARGELVSVDEQEVRDIDEEAFRRGVVKSRFFGVMQVPDEIRYVQQVKQGGREVEELVIADMADHIAESLEDDTLAIFGPGSTTHAILEALGRPATLLGFDVFRGDDCLVADANSEDLANCLAAHDGPVALYITAIGGQGHIIGRGNQQLTPAVLRRIGRDNLRVVATKTKLENLEGRPLLMDSGDAELDRQWRGFVTVLTGYHDEVLYRLGLDEE